VNRTRARTGALLRVLISVTALPAIFGFFCAAQAKPDIRQEAKTATCGNIVVTGGVATFSCSGLTPEQAKLLQDIPAILTKILKQTQDLSAIKGLINTEVQFHYEFRYDQASIRKTLWIYEHVAPANNIAKELRVIQVAAQMRGNFDNPNVSNEANQSAWSQFAQFASANRSKAVASDVGLTQARTVEDHPIQLSHQDIDDIRDHRLRIYIMSVALWKNVSGSRGSAVDCVYLGGDITPHDDPYNIGEHLPTHICPSSADNF
jgi:hypothetical protein